MEEEKASRSAPEQRENKIARVGDKDGRDLFPSYVVVLYVEKTSLKAQPRTKGCVEKENKSCEKIEHSRLSREKWNRTRRS